MDNPTVKRYLATLEALRQQASKERTLTKAGVSIFRSDFPDDPEEEPESIDQIERIRWALLRTASIFEIPAALYASLYHSADTYTTDLCGLKWTPPSNVVPPKEETEALVKVVREAAQRISWPEHVPFDVCYFGYEPGIQFTDNQHLLYHLPPVDCMLYGHLVDRAGNVVTFIRAADVKKGYRKIHIYPERWKKESTGEWIWQEPMTLCPWIVPTIIDWINDHKKVIEDKTSLFSYRSYYKSQAKKMGLKGHVPAPYYTIYLKDLRVEESARETFQTRFRKVIDWQHRWEVRGHECLKVRRGSLPLDPRLEKKLRKRKYHIFTLEKPDFETYHALAIRGVPPKRVDEWMAVLTYWRDPFVKGPADKPLIPGVRKSSRKRVTSLLKPPSESPR